MPPAPPLALAETCTVPLPELPNAVAVAVPPNPLFAPPFPPTALAETVIQLLPVAVPVAVAAALPPGDPVSGLPPIFQPLPPVPPTAAETALTESVVAARLRT
jgi:hypothetical protein